MAGGAVSGVMPQGQVPGLWMRSWVRDPLVGCGQTGLMAWHRDVVTCLGWVSMAMAVIVSDAAADF